MIRRVFVPTIPLVRIFRNIGTSEWRESHHSDKRKKCRSIWDVGILEVPLLSHKPGMSNYWDVEATGISLFRKMKRRRTKGMSEYWEPHLSEKIQYYTIIRQGWVRYLSFMARWRDIGRGEAENNNLNIGRSRAWIIVLLYPQMKMSLPCRYVFVLYQDRE